VIIQGKGSAQMASTGKPPLRGLAALVGSEGKRQVLVELAHGNGGLTVRELVERTGLQRNTVRHSLRQLSEAHLVRSRHERGRLIAEPEPERVGLLAELATLDKTEDAADFYPVPGQVPTRDQLEKYRRYLEKRPVVHANFEYSEEELSTPMSMLVMGDPVD
jgi:DNA-binding transcriptional ArsR family regulator